MMLNNRRYSGGQGNTEKCKLESLSEAETEL